VNRTLRHVIAYSPLLFGLLAFASVARAQWTAPTSEELKMTSQAEVPGAPAVFLDKEEITDDKLHMWSRYVRLKVLTERGKEYANVQLEQYSSTDRYGDPRGYTVNNIAGRTIHPDGTIIPFTGKPFEKLIEKGQGAKETQKVFTLPNVEVGSIIEYRYQLSYGDGYYIAPDWFIQSDLYTRKAHYLWRPTSQVTGIAWTPILPKGADLKQTRLPDTAWDSGKLSIELNVKDVPPTPDEEFMPPIASLSYRVLFYYTPFHSGEEFWKEEGKIWTKERDKFIGPGPKVSAAVKGLVADSDTQEQKLRKIYAAVMKLDNTSYSRDRSAAEEKAQGLSEAKSTDDVWERKRGGDYQIVQLFVAMARAAGMKAYVMGVTSRDHSFFLPSFYSFSQLDDDVAIVNVDGKEQFFDPSQRYCPYQQLAWKHTSVKGVRQTDTGTAIDVTPEQTYKVARTDRIADLNMDEHGEAAGTVTMIFRGAPALRWRQDFLRGDETSLKHNLETAVERLLPGGMEVKVNSIDKLEDYEQPLSVLFDVKGHIGSSTGKRLLLPSDLFESNAKPTFPHEKREIPVYFEYNHSVIDAVRVKFPASLTLESVPTAENLPFHETALYAIKADSTPTSITVHRNFLLGDIMYTPEQYPELRAFYNKFETKDQEPMVLKVTASTPAGN
jgi:Domain of Unknown Function with PDB structure (DUF3857)/Transglutaminase-like superfamily